MSWTTPCENCGATSKFLKDAAGFFVCLECGQQQQAYREEYRDEFDVLFETTGLHTSDLTDIRGLSRRQKSAFPFSQDNDSCRPPIYGEEDYDEEIERGNFDPEWNKKAPSEADFFRALQSILMHCTQHLVNHLGFPVSLNNETRKIWFLYLKLLVEMDYPAQTFFSDLKSRRHKIGFRRMYTPHVTPIDPITVLEDESIPLSIRMAERHMGMNRLEYVKSIAPFYNCSGSRRRGPAPEMIKIVQDKVSDEPRLTLPVPGEEEANRCSERESSVQFQNCDSQSNVIPSPRNEGCLDTKDVSGEIITTTQQKEKSYTVRATRKGNKCNVNPGCLVSQFYVLRPKRTVRERQREACLSMGIEPPKSSDTLPPTRTSIPKYRVPQYMRASPSNRFFKYPTDEREPTPLGFPQATLAVITRERGLSLGVKCNAPLHPHTRSRRSTHLKRIIVIPSPRWQVDMIYEHDLLVCLLDLRRTHCLRESIFTCTDQSALSNVTTVADSEVKPGTSQSETSSGHPTREKFLGGNTRKSKMTEKRNRKTKALNKKKSGGSPPDTCRDEPFGTGNADDDPSNCCAGPLVLADERSIVGEEMSNERMMTFTDEDLRRWADEWLQQCMENRSSREFALRDTDVHIALNAWKQRGLMSSSLFRGVETHHPLRDTVEQPMTITASHERYFSHKPLRHEFSVAAMIERILRHWMKSTYTASSSTQDTAGDVVHKLQELSTIAAIHGLELSKDVSCATQSTSDSIVSTDIVRKDDASTKTGMPCISTSLVRSYVDVLVQNQHNTDNTALVDKAPRCTSETTTPDDSATLPPATVLPACFPLKRLDPFYHQDDWSSCAVTTPVERIVEWRRILSKNYEQFKKQRDPTQSFEIFDRLTLCPAVSMCGGRVLLDDEIIDLLKDAYLSARNLPQLKFLPLLKHLLQCSPSWYRHFLRSICIREVYTLAAPCCLLKSRLYKDTTDYPDSRCMMSLGIYMWCHPQAILPTDMCRWVDGGVIPLNSALSSIPVWLFEASGICDKYTKFSLLHSVLRQDMIFRDRSILQLSQPIRARDLEVTLVNLKTHGFKVAPFVSIALVPRLVHHCGLSTYIQPLAVSLLNVIHRPLTQYQDGYTTISRQQDAFADAIYGYWGPFPSPQTVASSILIVCRLLWPIFVYQPLGPPGIPESKKSRGPQTYVPPSPQSLNESTTTERSLLYFDLRSNQWVATLPHHADAPPNTFSASNTSFLDAGLQALQWIKTHSPTDFETLCTKFTKNKSQPPTKYSDVPRDTVQHPSCDLSFLFTELCGRNQRKEAYQFDQKPQDTCYTDLHYPPIQKIIDCLPTNQELFNTLVHHANKPGWLESCQPWNFMNDSWSSSTDLEKQIMMQQLGHWIYRPTLNQGRWKDTALSLVAETSEQEDDWSYPAELKDECNAFINEHPTHSLSEEVSPLRLTPSLQEQELDSSPQEKMPHEEDVFDVSSVEEMLHILYRIYLFDILNTFQEPPMPTRCIHPVDVTFKSAVNDSPFDEIRFPVPYAILLRRISSFIGVNHLVVHAATTKLENWLFVSEVPERFKQIECNSNHNLPQS